jgi:hypothetical protein
MTDMSREMEYYEQFGAVSCSDPGDRPSISDAEESGFSDVEEEPGSEPGDKPSIGDEESTGAAG